MSKRGFTRRRLLQGSAVGTALAGAGAFFGPWAHNRAYAQSKPIKLGLTCDASGQYGNSGQDDLRGIKIAIEEFNAKGGVLGRKIEWITADTETNPATGTRIAERFIREDCSILIGALHSGVANATTQVANKHGTISTLTPRRRARPARTARASSSSGTATARTSPRPRCAAPSRTLARTGCC